MPAHGKRGPLARDIMQRTVAVVAPEADLWQIARVFVENGVTGAPVVDADGRPIGVVSQTDLVQHFQRTGLLPFTGPDFYADGSHENDGLAAGRVTARQIMNPTVIHAPEDATLAELRRMMLKHRIHRVIICDGQRIAGIVTTMDILRAQTPAPRRRRPGEDHADKT